MDLCRLWQDAESRVYLVNELDKRTGQVKFQSVCISICLLFLVQMVEGKGEIVGFGYLRLRIFLVKKHLNCLPLI